MTDCTKISLMFSCSYLCFERMSHALRDGDRISIPLEDVVLVKKAKPFAVIPGSGMSIEITCSNRKKVQNNYREGKVIVSVPTILVSEFSRCSVYCNHASISSSSSICSVQSWAETKCIGTYWTRGWCSGCHGDLTSLGWSQPRAAAMRRVVLA